MSERDDSARRAGESAGLSVSGVETDAFDEALAETRSEYRDALDRLADG